MSTILCRFDCWNVLEAKDFKGDKVSEEVHLHAATMIPGDEDNAKEINSFSEYTPSGKLEFTVTNKAVFGHFRPGFSYYLNIEEVPMEKQPQYIKEHFEGKK